MCTLDRFTALSFMLLLGMLLVAVPVRGGSQATSVAGTTTIGTTAYPDGGLRRLGADYGLAARDFRTVLIDSEGGYAYLGTYGTPAAIIKLALGDQTTTARVVSSTLLSVGENFCVGGVIDPVAGYAYFVTLDPDLKVVKVALGAGDSAPTRQSALTLAAGSPSGYVEHYVGTCIDAGRGFALVVSSKQRKAYKISLTPGAAAPELLSTIDGAGGVAYDPNTGYALSVTTGDAPEWPDAKVSKWKVGAAGEPITLVSSATYAQGYDPDTSPFTLPVLIPEQKAIVFLRYGRVSSGSPSVKERRMYKFAFGDGDSTPTMVVPPVKFSVGGWGYDPLGATYDPVRGEAWFTSESSSVSLKGVAVGGPGQPPAEIGYLPLLGMSGRRGVFAADLPRRTAYFGAASTYGLGDAAYIQQISLGDASTAPAASAMVDVPGADSYFQARAVDSVTGQIFLASSYDPLYSRIAKFATASDGSVATELSTLKLTPEEGSIQLLVCDPVRRHLYAFTRGGSAPDRQVPMRVIKLSLGAASAPPARLSTLLLPESLPASSDRLWRSAIASPDSALAFATIEDSQNGSDFRASLLVLTLADGSATPTITQQINNGDATSNTIIGFDEARKRLYLTRKERLYTPWTGTQDTFIYQLDLPKAGQSWPVDLSRTSESVVGSFGGALVDPQGGKLYAVADGDTGNKTFSIYTYPLWDPNKLGPRSNFDVSSASLRFVSSELGFDSRLGKLFFHAPSSSNSGPPMLAVAKLDSARTRLESITAIPLKQAEGINNASWARDGQVLRILMQEDQGRLWLLTKQPGPGIAYAYTQKGALHGTRIQVPGSGQVTSMRFHSHSAAGKLRFAIYSDSEPKQVLWQSAEVNNSGAGATVEVPISSGIPNHLSVAAGTYWLAWQTDSTENIGSYTAGAAGAGFTFTQAFGPVPETLATGVLDSTTATWTQSIVFTPDNPVTPSPSPSTTPSHSPTPPPTATVTSSPSPSQTAAPSPTPGESTFLQQILGRSGEPAPAPEQLDTNGDGAIDSADLIFTLMHM